MLNISCHFIPLKPLTLWMDQAKLLDVLTSLPGSHEILPRVLCSATSRPANHAICSYTHVLTRLDEHLGPSENVLFINYIIGDVVSEILYKQLTSHVINAKHLYLLLL